MNGPKATSALSPFDSQLRTLIGAARRSHSCHKPERLDRLQIDDELEFRRLQHGQVGRLGALQDLTGVGADLTIHVHTIGIVGHQLPLHSSNHWQWKERVPPQGVRLARAGVPGLCSTSPCVASQNS
jgi:hypothetical protein